MASGKRQPSKQKRAAQNRAQRAALAARRDAASAPPRATASGSSGARGSGRGGGGIFDRLRGGAASPTGAAGDGGGIRAQLAAGRAAQPIGYRAGLSSLLMALAGIVFCFTFQVPVDADGDSYTRASLIATWGDAALDAAAQSPDASAEDLAGEVDDWTPGRNEEPIAIALWPYSLALALPAIGAGIGFRAVAKRSASKVVSRALFATLFGALLSQIPIFFLPSVIALGVAVFQIRKYETVALAAAQRDAAGGSPAGGDVIEADVVDDDDGHDVAIEADAIEAGGDVVESDVSDGDTTDGDTTDGSRPAG